MCQVFVSTATSAAEAILAFGDTYVDGDSMLKFMLWPKNEIKCEMKLS